MKRFDRYTVMRMAGRNATPFVYKPFPGKYPIRLSVRITFRDEASIAGRDHWFVRMDYNGHWSYPILRRALRIWNRLLAQQPKNPGLVLSCTVTEYCQTGVVYTGDLFYGTYSQGHAMSYLFHLSSKGNLRNTAEYRIEKLVPVRCDGFTVMVPEVMVRGAVTQEQKNVLYQEIRQSRKRWEAA